jgi:hypothetical protein
MRRAAGKLRRVMPQTLTTLGAERLAALLFELAETRRGLVGQPAKHRLTSRRSAKAAGQISPAIRPPSGLRTPPFATRARGAMNRYAAANCGVGSRRAKLTGATCLERPSVTCWAWRSGRWGRERAAGPSSSHLPNRLGFSDPNLREGAQTTDGCAAQPDIGGRPNNCRASGGLDSSKSWILAPERRSKLSFCILG